MTTATATGTSTEFKPALWTPGDWNAFFGFGTRVAKFAVVAPKPAEPLEHHGALPEPAE